MSVALFIPCYVDQIKPNVGIATVRLLSMFGVDYSVLSEPVCCGQPLVNMGAARAAAGLVRQLATAAGSYEAIVCPSGSCVASIRHTQRGSALAARVFELSDYLLRLGRVPRFGEFARRVMLHPSCHGLRELELGASSELCLRDQRDCVAELLSRVPNLTLLRPVRDECCGFGGTFAVAERALSVRMGEDRLAEYVTAGAEVVTATDVSCLMHLEGIAKEQNLPLSFLHFAEVLAEAAGDA